VEKIKHAIEKARQQRGELSAATATCRPTARRRLSRSVISIIGKPALSRLTPDHLEKHRIVALNKSDLNSVAFDLLRTQVLQKMEEHGWRTLAVVSPVPECGKTVVAINLAMSIAHHTNKTAILVDFDLRKPKIAEYLGLPAGISLNEVLEGEADVSEAFINPSMPKLVVATTAKSIRKSAELLASGKVKALVKDLRDRYQERIVIFDLPPLLNVDDAISLLPQI
jgi:protein-tyrosine kinase